MDKHNLKTVALSLSTALLLGITGCSSDSSNDDSSGGGTTPATSYSGIAIDGILMDAQVCIDANEDSVCNFGETITRTDSAGEFEFPAGSPTGPLILSGGYDKSLTDGLNADGTTKYKLFEGVLKAPAGSSVVTPLTSAIQSLMDNNSSVTAADAEATVKTAMGLDDVSVSLTEFDPYNGVDSNNSADVVAAQKILAKQTQLQVLVYTASATIAGADENTDVNDTMSHVFDALVQSMGTGAEVELDAQTVAIATRQAAAKTFENAANKDALIVAVGTVAQAQAEDAVSAANGAETAILGGSAGDAIKVLDAAIDNVNKEDGNATKAAVSDQSDLTADERTAIITARDNEDAAAKEAAEKEAAAVAAREAADKALADAATKDDLEAAEKLRAEAAAAEQLAAEKAAFEAEKAQEKATAEAAAELLTAQEADDAKAAAQSEQDAAEAEALAAKIEAEAAEAAASAIGNADTDAELEQLKADAAAAALAAEQAKAEDLIGSYMVVVENSVVTIEKQRESIFTLVKDYNLDTPTFDMNVTDSAVLQAAVSRLLLVEYNRTTPVADLNTTYAETLKDDVLMQSSIVSDEYSKVQAIVSEQELENSIRQATIARIEAQFQLIADVNTNLNEKISASSSSETALRDFGAVIEIAGMYSDNVELQGLKAEAIAADNAISEASLAIKTSMNTVEGYTNSMEDILSTLDEAEANRLAEEAVLQETTVEEKLKEIDTQAADLEAILVKAKAIQETIAGVEGKSLNVENAVNRLNTFNPTKESLTDTLAEIKNTLGTENQDELVLAAFIDIADIVNSDAVQNLIDTNSSLPNLDAFSGDTDVMVTMASTATTLGGTELMQVTAEKLKSASDVIANAFTNSTKVMEYGDINITANDALLVRAGALSAASALELLASYDYGDISYAKIQTKSINGEEYEYMEGDIDPLALFGQDTFLKMQNSSRLADAGVTLKTAATLYVSIDPSYIQSKDLNTSGAESLLAAFNGDGLFKQPDGSSVNVNKIFSSSDYIDRDDLNIPTSYIGYSSDVLAEYNKAADYYDTVETYVNDGCSGDFPTSDIDWNLLSNAERNVTVTLDTDLSIVEHETAYMPSRPINFDPSWAENDCQFITYHSDSYGEADFDITPKASFNDVIIPVTLADKFVSGATFYTHFNDGDDTFIKIELTSDSDVTETERMYYPDENGTLVSDTYTYTGTYSVDVNDTVTMSVVRTDDADYKDTYYFTLEDAWDDGMEMKVLIDVDQDGTINDEFSNEYSFVKPDWYPADF